MVVKSYSWVNGAILEDHTRRKHKILREYFFQYLTVRCQNPQQTKFRLAVIDGFSGAGRYACGSAGSPIIFIEEIEKAFRAVNLKRVSQGFQNMEIECLLVFNDTLSDVTSILKENCEPLLGHVKNNCPGLHLHVSYLSDNFENSYQAIRELVAAGRYRSVLYNLDQYGHSKVELATIIDIMNSTPSVEIFYTFAIQSLLTFLSRVNPALAQNQLRHLDMDISDLRAVEGIASNNSWLGAAERIVFENFRNCAPFVSPFSINNPNGWRYWLIHFANNYRARQVYNDVLHSNSSNQAHFGRSGLNMLSYDVEHESNQLYLFDKDGRASAQTQLLSDIPRMVAEVGDAIRIREFYEAIYNNTPAHKDDIHTAIIESADLAVLTSSGNERRKGNKIDVEDTLKLKNQRTFSMFTMPKKS